MLGGESTLYSGRGVGQGPGGVWCIWGTVGSSQLSDS